MHPLLGKNYKKDKHTKKMVFHCHLHLNELGENWSKRNLKPQCHCFLIGTLTWQVCYSSQMFCDYNQSFVLPAVVIADLWKLGHHNPDQVVSAYCVHGALRPSSNCLLQSSKSCLTY